jgi:hypothetical protein
MMKSMLVLLLLLGIPMLALSDGVEGQSEEEILRLKIRELELRKEILELEAKSSQHKASISPSENNRNYERPITQPAPANSNSLSSGYIRGPRGGCYTYSKSGRKKYVDRSLCN